MARSVDGEPENDSQDLADMLLTEGMKWALAHLLEGTKVVAVRHRDDVDENVVYDIVDSHWDSKDKTVRLILDNPRKEKRA